MLIVWQIEGGSVEPVRFGAFLLPSHNSIATMTPLTISAGSGADDGSHPWNGGRSFDSGRHHEALT